MRRVRIWGRFFCLHCFFFYDQRAANSERLRQRTVARLVGRLSRLLRHVSIAAATSPLAAQADPRGRTGRRKINHARWPRCASTVCTVHATSATNISAPYYYYCSPDRIEYFQVRGDDERERGGLAAGPARECVCSFEASGFSVLGSPGGGVGRDPPPE